MFSPFFRKFELTAVFFSFFVILILSLIKFLSALIGMLSLLMLASVFFALCVCAFWSVCMCQMWFILLFITFLSPYPLSLSIPFPSFPLSTLSVKDDVPMSIDSKKPSWKFLYNDLPKCMKFLFFFLKHPIWISLTCLYSGITNLMYMSF